MDHRISKDMISSGMTPSGQRSQQDLSRSQYGSAATPSSLAEAYKKICDARSGEPMEEAADPFGRPGGKYGGVPKKGSSYDKAYKANMKKIKELEREGYDSEGEIVEGGPALPGEPNRPGTPKAPGGRPHLPGEKPTPKPGLRLAGADLFDIVKGHLMSEHECSEDIAIQLMTLLDEETKEDIMEYTAAIRADAAPKGTTMKMTADGKEPAGDKLLRGIRDRVGGFLQRLNPKAMKSTTVEPRKPLVATPKNEAYVVTNADKMGNTKAYQNFKSGMKGKDGKPLYKAAPHLRGV